MANLSTLSNLSLVGNLKFALNNNDFPSNPSSGLTAFVNNILYIYTEVDGVSTWFPLTNKKSSFVYAQGVNSAQWVINHNLNSENAVVIVYDEYKRQIFPMIEITSVNTVTLNFSVSSKGKAVIFAEVTNDDVRDFGEFISVSDGIDGGEL